MVKITKISEIIKKNNVGTKNLPDAIKWHCTFFWDHALSKKTCNYSKYTKELLNTAIAIPILVKNVISFNVFLKDKIVIKNIIIRNNIK